MWQLMFSKNSSTHALYAMNLKENTEEDMYKPQKINIKNYPLRYLNCKLNITKILQEATSTQ